MTIIDTLIGFICAVLFVIACIPACIAGVWLFRVIDHWFFIKDLEKRADNLLRDNYERRRWRRDV